MKSSAWRLRLIGMPLFTLILSTTLVSYEYARRNRLAHELKEAQTEYTRLSKSMAKVPSSASAMMAESSEHTHSDSEGAEAHGRH